MKSRNKKFQEERQMRIERLKELNVPDSVIENEIIVSKMTLEEHLIYCLELKDQEKKFKSEYAKNNPIQKSIVDEIYSRESKLGYDYFVYFSNTHFEMAIDPLSFMSQDDYDNDLYLTFMEHAKELYRGRYKENYEIDSKNLSELNAENIAELEQYFGKL